jgi:cell division protein FtsI (penicillin-binding protein 3)
VGVVERGTGTAARLSGFPVAGKTGTAQKADGDGYAQGKYVASFAGFLPASDPIVVILVVLDEPQAGFYGGEVAAPVFRRIAERIITTEGASVGDDLVRWRLRRDRMIEIASLGEGISSHGDGGRIGN